MSDQNIKKLEISLDLPLEVTGLVVGKKGATINKIKVSSKANVVLSPDPLAENQKLKRLTIQGTKREVDLAQDQIIKILNTWCGFESETGENHRNIDLLPDNTRSIVLAYKSKQGQQQTRAAAQGHSNQQGAAHASGQYVQPSHHAQERAKPTQPLQYSSKPANHYDACNSATAHGYYSNVDNAAVVNGQQQGYRGAAPNAVAPPPR